MNPNGQPYSPPYGFTPQGQAVANAQPNQSNTQAPPPTPGGSSSSYGSWDQLNNNYAQANQNLVTANAPATRQALVSNSDVPAEQVNYEDLAKKLFDYDQGTLAPQFATPNPGVPSDAASFGRVDASPLAMTPQSAGLPAAQGMAIGNPKANYAIQGAQATNISDLLGTLNSAIASTMTDVKGKNASNVNSAQAAVDSIYKLMDLKSQAQDREMQMSLDEQRIGAQYAQMAQDRQLKLIDMGYIDPLTGDLYKDNNGKPALETPQEYADAFMGGYTKWGDIPNSMKVAVTNLVKKQGGNVQKITDSYTGLQNSLSIINNIQSKWNSMSFEEQHMPSAIAKIFPALAPNKAALTTTFYTNLVGELRKAVVGGRITQQEMNWIQGSIIPSATDSPQSAEAKLNAVKFGLQMKLQNPNYSIGDNTIQDAQTMQNIGGSSSTKTYQGHTYKKVNGGWQKVN